MNMTRRTEKFAERLWGYVKENRGSLDSEKWVGLIASEIDARIQAGTTPLKIQIEDLKGKLADTQEKLAAEKIATKHIIERIQKG